jgi:hypothetical protein
MINLILWMNKKIKSDNLIVFKSFISHHKQYFYSSWIDKAINGSLSTWRNVKNYDFLLQTNVNNVLDKNQTNPYLGGHML